MIKELNNFNTRKFKEYLDNGDVSDDEVLNILHLTLNRPEILIIRDSNGNRDKRNEFLEELIELTINRSVNIEDFIVNKVQIVCCAEELFDNISKCLGDCDISLFDSDFQVWSHISRVELKFKQIKEDLENHKDKVIKNKLLSQFIMLENSEGVSYSPDAASEHLIMYLSLTLSLLAYRFKWFKDDKVTLSNRVDVNDDGIFKAGSIELFARSWKELEDTALRSLLFGGDVFLAKDEQVQEDAKKSGVKKAYHFERKESDFEYFDAISCERLKKKSFQNFLQIISKPEIRAKIASNFVNVGKLEDGSFLCEDEIQACCNLDDVFCTDIFTDNTEYNGLTLRDWIRSYFVLRYLAEQVTLGNEPSIVGKDHLLELFYNAGISNKKALCFIDIVSFGRDSKDLYDCPLIKMEGDDYYFSYFSLTNANISNLILSRFSSLEAKVSNKGYKFEKYTNDMVSKYLSESKSFKFKRGVEEYEYDSVFILDKKLFILECKNRSLSWLQPVKVFRYKQYLLQTAQQITRLKNALTEYPEVITEHFGVNVNEYEIVPVILNCMPFSWRGRIEGVYVSDFSSLSKFAKNSKINMVMVNSEGQSECGLSKLRLWSGSKPNADDLVRHLEDPIQLKPYLNSRKENPAWWVSNNEVAFTVVYYEIDTEKYVKNERSLFTVTPIKAKVLKKKGISKRKIQKISKRKNRKK
ncbi:Nuclease-related domain family protein [Aliivibrio fischeri MJ11]|uniref:Nuclease-related domain family protein n=1 Tax=Aliivibrio fischeri (strain MJ11) TaxID=388396 RepID=B5EUB3_ALIFM|nr:nuclease-related domain-containing protein [Aliivibrio fischeri]ACH63540.1 Nuclease-related domain family protein [Aliivibrio fischeri MJ11]